MTDSRHVLGMRVDATTYQEAASEICRWADGGASEYVCVANVHMAMESYDRISFRQIVNAAGLVTPDGMPLVWALRLMGVKGQSRVYGPHLTLAVCSSAARRGIPIALYGGRAESLEAFSRFLLTKYPSLKIVCQIAPPFRPTTGAEDLDHVEQLRQSGAAIVLVGVGCPKQEQWMAAHKGRVPAVMVGVGAAFDFYSGRVKQAPNWVQKVGLEWLFRLMMEPRRLWKRYLKHNPRFVFLFLLQLLGIRRFKEV